MSVSVTTLNRKWKLVRKIQIEQLLSPHGTPPRWTLTCSTQTFPWLYYRRHQFSFFLSTSLLPLASILSHPPNLFLSRQLRFFFLPTAVNTNLLRSDWCRNLSWWLLVDTATVRTSFLFSLFWHFSAERIHLNFGWGYVFGEGDSRRGGATWRPY